MLGVIQAVQLFRSIDLLNQNSYIKIQNVGLNPTRIGFYEILKKHNAN